MMYKNKTLWAILNILKPKALVYKDTINKEESEKKIVVLIDYEKFINRTTKIIKNYSYACGRDGINQILSYCKNNSIPYIDIITTDSEIEIKTDSVILNDKNIINNYGTDIAALRFLIPILKKYNNVIVINSSLNVKDAHLIDAVLKEVSAQNSGEHFVIGVNGNSRLSPTLPFLGAHAPHIITNFFAAPSADIIETIESESSNKISKYSEGYSNKYFAIRYFEIKLSLNAIKNNGILILLKDGKKIIYNKDNKEWPSRDTRF